MADGMKQSRLWCVAGLFITLSGLVWVLSGKTPLGIMNICIGMMLFAIGAAARRRAS